MNRAIYVMMPQLMSLFATLQVFHHRLGIARETLLGGNVMRSTIPPMPLLLGCQKSFRVRNDLQASFNAGLSNNLVPFHPRTRELANHVVTFDCRTSPWPREKRTVSVPGRTALSPRGVTVEMDLRVFFG